MIFIKTHKDFDFYNIPIYKENYNDFSIICREKLNDNYPINIIHDYYNPLNVYSFLFTDLTYDFYIYTHKIKNDNIIGFIQFGRFFDNYTLNNYEKILNQYDVIIPEKYPLIDNLITQYNHWHVKGLLEETILLICKYMPEYSDINFYKIDYIIPHNIYIMKKEDFIKYCQFLFYSFEILNKELNIYETCLNKRYFKILSLLAERLSTLFYINYFERKNKLIYYSKYITKE